MKKLIGLFLLAITLFLSNTHLVSAQFPSPWRSGTDVLENVDDQQGTRICTDCNVVTIKGFEAIVTILLHNIVRFLGVVAFLIFIFGGFKWLTSGGDAKKIESAKNMITYAVLGLVILLISWLILGLIQYFTNVDVKRFEIPI